MIAAYSLQDVAADPPRELDARVQHDGFGANHVSITNSIECNGRSHWELVSLSVRHLYGHTLTDPPLERVTI